MIGKVTTEVLATSYFRNDAEFKTSSTLIDGFANHDTTRLAELLGDAYVPFTDAELTALAKIPSCIISKEWFMDYEYSLGAEGTGKTTEFYNPTTLEHNVFLSFWGCFSTSPFENACVFEQDDIAVTSVTVSPSTATVSKGQTLDLKATVATTGFANKGVFWGINKVAEDNGAVITQEGKLKIPSNFPTSGTGTAGVYTINIATALATSETIKVDSVTYTVSAEDDTAAKQGAALRSALNVTAITDKYVISGSGANAILTEKSGLYGQVGAPEFTVTTESGSATMTSTTPGVIPDATIIVSATSVYDNTKEGIATITVA